MSANRDKSQKIGFVYTNIYQIYKAAKNAPEAEVQAAGESLASTSESSRVIRAEDLTNFKITKFEPRALGKVESMTGAPLPKGENPFDDLKNNLNRLQDLHSRLRFMLKELEDLVGKKKN